MDQVELSIGQYLHNLVFQFTHVTLLPKNIFPQYLITTTIKIKPEQNQSTTQEKTNQARPEARTNAVNKPSQHKKKTKSGGNQQHKVVLSKEETGERK